MSELHAVEVPGFALFGGHHCETSALRKLLKFRGFEYSEELLFGLGGGISFVYWADRRLRFPFIGGRNGRFPEFVQRIGHALGHPVRVRRSRSPKRAMAQLYDELDGGQPVICYGDIHELPYFGVRRHFGGHAFLVYGLDPVAGTVAISDRGLQPRHVTLDALAAARSSGHHPFPPRHASLVVDTRDDAVLETGALRSAIASCCDAMLRPPIRNLGLSGLARFGEAFDQARAALEHTELLAHAVEAYVNIELAGTGGSAFRAMYRRFLDEAAAILQDERASEAAELLELSIVAWQQLLAALLPDDKPALARLKAGLQRRQFVFEHATMTELEAEPPTIEPELNHAAARELVEHPRLADVHLLCDDIARLEALAFEVLQHVVA